MAPLASRDAIRTGETKRRIAVVVPAHNEEAVIGACLESLDRAAEIACDAGHFVRIIVVCDACTDSTAEIVWSFGHVPRLIDARNVGIGRSHGAAEALAQGADWLAFTDADSQVAPDWLSAQLGLGADVVCGTVEVDDWGAYGDPMAHHFAATYFDVDGHRHIHGANLGMSAAAYTRVGGFAHVANSEDVLIVQALKEIGASIAWSNRPRVVTSARVDFRATAGFGATLAAVAAANAM